MTKALLALCLVLGPAAAAQDIPPMSVLVKPAEPQSPYAGICARMIESALLQGGLEVMAPGSASDLERLAEAIGEQPVDDAARLAAAPPADVTISYQLVESADGGRRSFRLHLEARATVTAEAIASAQETSAPFASGPGQAERALAGVCEAGGAALVKQLQTFREGIARDGAPLLVTVKDGPEGIALMLNIELKKLCSKVRLQRDSGREVAFDCRCKGESFEVASAIAEVLSSKAPGKDYDKIIIRDTLLFVFKP